MSDTCARGEKVDKSGPALKELVTNTSTKIGNLLKGNVVCEAIVPDDKDLIMVITNIFSIFPLFVVLIFIFIYLIIFI